MKLFFKWLVIVVLLATSGCATIGSKEATVICQGADTVTTIVALQNGAVEVNPLMAGVIHVLGIPGLILVKLGLILLLNRDDVPTELRAGVNVVTCGVAAHNLGVN